MKKKKKLLLIVAVTLLMILVTGTIAFGSSAKVDSSTYTHPGKFSNTIVLDGVDVSYHQGSIDWEKVKRQGIDFAFIRIGYTSLDSPFSMNSDSWFETNYTKAKAAGVQVGIYYYSHAISATESRKEANWVLDKLNGRDLDLPIVMDYEFYTGARLKNAYNSWSSSTRKAKMTTNALAFLKVIRDGGYDPMFYSYRAVMDPSFSSKACFNMDLIDIQYKIWIANYGTNNSYNGDYEFWQYTSGGSVTGISGRSDCNFWYFDPDKEKTKSGTTSIKECNISLGTSTYAYTKFQKKPKVTVTYGGTTLTKDVDYKLYYIKNVYAGTGYAMVRGIGNYSNVALSPFKITTRNISGVKVADISDREYTGSSIKPTIKVSYTGTTLKLNHDYKVSYSNNKNVGTATVTITGIRNFNGSITRTFKITKSDTEFTGTSTYSKKASDNPFTLNTKSNSGATLSYSSSDTSIATVDSTGKVTLKGNTGTVYITVSSPSYGNYNSATKKITINVANSAAVITTGYNSYTRTTLNKYFNLNAESDSGAALTYSSDNTDVADVDYMGKVVLKGVAGVANITITCPANGSYAAGSKTVKVTVNKAPQEIEGYSLYSKIPSSSQFTLNAASSAGSLLIYKSNDTSVAAVAAGGSVTINGTGKAVITVTAASTIKYSSATHKVTVNVAPFKQVITTTSPAKGKLRVYVKTDSKNADGYQVKYSRNKDFSRYVYTKNIDIDSAKYRTYTATAGKTYYVKARAYAVAKDGSKVYGKYSDVKSIRVK